MSAADNWDVPASALRGKRKPAVEATVFPGDPATAPPERVRARTVSMKRYGKHALTRGAALYPATVNAEYARPATRAECLQGEHAARPCPFVSCKHHLYLDVSEKSGGVKVNRPDVEVWEMAESCALDVADRGEMTLEDVGAVVNVTRERVRQIETRGLAKLKALSDLAALAEYLDDEPAGHGPSRSAQYEPAHAWRVPAELCEAARAAKGGAP